MSPQNDSAFLRMFLFVLGALVAFSIIIMFIASSVSQSLEEAPAGDSRLQAQIAERLAPVGSVEVAAANAAPAAPKSGDQVVAEACNACHGTGALGAPKVGDGSAWQARMGGGLDALVASAIAGKGQMPARGGVPSLSDAEIRAAVEHMLNESGVEVAASDSAAEPAAAPVEQAVEAVEQAADQVAEAAQGAAGAAGDMASSAMGAVADAAGAMMPQADAPAADLENGKAVYNSACFVCHATGAANAPRLGDTAAWAPRIATGMDALNSVAINGRGGMPPKGGRMDLSDQAVMDAVAYMVQQSQ